MLRQAEPRRNLPGPLVRQPLPSANTAQDLLAAATRGAAFSRAAKWFFIWRRCRRCCRQSRSLIWFSQFPHNSWGIIHAPT